MDGGFALGLGERHTYIQAQNYKAVPPFQFLWGGFYVRVYIRVLHTCQSVASLSIFVFKHIYMMAFAWFYFKKNIFTISSLEGFRYI